MALGIGGIRRGFLEARGCRVARVDHGLERAAFVAHVAFDGFDEVGNEVVAARELNVDLRESVTHAVARVDEIVVHRDRVPDDGSEDYQGDDRSHEQAPSRFGARENTLPSAGTLSRNWRVRCVCDGRRASGAGRLGRRRHRSHGYPGLGRAVGRRRGPRSRPRGRGHARVPSRRRCDEHLQARQRDLARQRSCRRVADGDQRRVVRARRALARAVGGERRRLRHHLRQRRLLVRLPCPPTADGRADRRASRRRRLSPRRARSCRAVDLLQDRRAYASTWAESRRATSSSGPRRCCGNAACSTRCSMPAATRV